MKNRESGKMQKAEPVQGSAFCVYDSLGNPVFHTGCMRRNESNIRKQDQWLIPNAKERQNLEIVFCSNSATGGIHQRKRRIFNRKESDGRHPDNSGGDDDPVNADCAVLA